MKKPLSIIFLAVAFFGPLPRASAGTTILYTEDWGSVNGGRSFPAVGWTLVAPSGSPPYEGFYSATGANDSSSGSSLPAETTYYTGLTAGQTGMIYTVAGAGAGTGGDSAFNAIDPTQFAAVTLSVEANDEGSPVAANYFAVQVGGAWYVSATALTASSPTYPAFTLTGMSYTNLASAWNQLTINATNVTIGAAAAANLSGPITGVGIVEVGAGGWNYNEVVISATPSPTVYTEDWGSVNGGRSFPAVGWTLVAPSGSPPYEGFFSATGANDSSSGSPLPAETIYYTGLTAGQTGMIYTVAGAGAGTGGDSAFNAIDPTEHTDLTLSVEANDNGSAAANYFAVQVGGAWYVSATALTASSPTYPAFTLTGTPYTNLASAWNQLTINATNVTIGAAATANLSGPITGIGIVEVGAGGWNYNEIIISASVPPTTVPPTATLYAEDWGTAYLRATGTVPNTLTEIGWSSSGIAYSGMFEATGALDPATGETFPPPPIGNITTTNNAAYASLDSASYIGILYTTDTNGAGADGDSSFADINPANYAGGIVFNAESQFNNFPVLGPAASYFAVQIGAVAGVGGQWYVSTTPFANDYYYPFFASNSLAFNPGSNNWDTLTFQEGAVDPTGAVAIGTSATNNLSGLITGIGVVEVGDSAYAGGATGYGFNYVAVSVTTPLDNTGDVAPKIDAPGFSQTTYAGGTASFAVDAFVGTAPLTYTWTLTTSGFTNILLDGARGTGSFIIGATSDVITISNVSSADAGTYSVEVSNSHGSDDSTNYTTNTLTVNPVPSDVLYAETFPFVGPFQTGESPTNVGWFAAAPAGTSSLNYGDQLYASEASAATTGFFTTSATDVPGLSGLPFTNINPANFTFVSFRATMANPASTATVYFAVQMTGGQWYISSSAIQLTGTAGYNTYGLQFSPAMLEWDTLTVSGTSASIGSTATADLTGEITGAGLVFVFSGTATAEFDLQSFELVTDSTPPALPSFPSEPDVPYPQTVYAGGGVSFFFTEAGTLPLTNNWQFNDNGIDLVDGVTATGSIIIGSQTTEITLENVSSADAGTYDPTVSNAAGTNNVDGSLYGPPALTVVSPPLGLIYNESFPLYAPTGGVNQPLGIIGWTNQSDTPNRVFHLGSALVGTGAAYDYESFQTNSLFYASTATDTGFSGLPFIAFDPANYPAGSIGFSTSMEAGDSVYTNASASFAVEQGGQWYAMATAVEPTNSPTLSTTAYTALGPQIYSPLASQWKTLTLVGTEGVVVGGPPVQNLSGPITAAGLLFQNFGTSGASLDYDSFTIQATGSGSLIGGINIGPVVNGSATLSWVGNAGVNVQSSTDLIHWLDVSGTLGSHMLTVSATTNKEVYYRLVDH